MHTVKIILAIWAYVMVMLVLCDGLLTMHDILRELRVARRERESGHLQQKLS